MRVALYFPRTRVREGGSDKTGGRAWPHKKTPPEKGGVFFMFRQT